MGMGEISVVPLSYTNIIMPSINYEWFFWMIVEGEIVLQSLGSGWLAVCGLDGLGSLCLSDVIAYFGVVCDLASQGTPAAPVCVPIGSLFGAMMFSSSQLGVNDFV